MIASFEKKPESGRTPAIAIVGIVVIECVALKDDGTPVAFLPNWRGSLAVFRLRKK